MRERQFDSNGETEHREQAAATDPAADRCPQGARLRQVRPLFAPLIVALVAALIVLGCVQGANLPGARGGPPGNDSGLFVRIVEDLHHGESYYSAVTREHRALDYPLRPVFTVRLPTLAIAMAGLPEPFTRRLSVQFLAVASFAAWLFRLRTLTRTPLSFSLATLVLGAAHGPAFISFGYTIHELWAGLIISLSLATYRPQRWGISLAIALLALAIRELTIGYFVAMAVLAWREGRPREATAWVGGILALALALVIHATLLAPFVTPTDESSPGWLGLNGWRFVLLQMKWNMLLMTAPDWTAAVLAPLALLGLAGASGALADRLLLVVGGYLGAFLVVGRPDNAYWGLLVAPLWPLGLYLLVATLRDLIKRGCTLKRKMPPAWPGASH